MYTNFLKSRTCYDIMPKSSKIVVFDTKLRVSNASFIYIVCFAIGTLNDNFTDWLNVFLCVCVIKTS